MKRPAVDANSGGSVRDRRHPPAEWIAAARAIKHEMSNIVMGMLGHAELLEEDAVHDAKTRRRARAILGEVRRLQGQLDALNALCRGDDRD